MDPALGVVSAVSDANGTYRFVNVPAGQYTVKFELSGLGATTRRATIGASGTFVVNGHLKFAAVSESITVTAEAPAMTAGIGYTASSARPAPARRTATKSPIYIEDDITEAPSYTTIKENGYIETAKETTTTFAIDVDRASYANVRRYLAANELPPADAVRIEEMINYFNYAYPQPTGVDPFSVTSEVAGCPWDLTHRLVRIGIQGRNLDEWKMSPNNLVFLIDVSGSMQSPERLPLIKSSFRILVDHLRVEDVVSIVVYAGAAGVVLPPTSGADKRTIVAALDQLQSGGSTAGGEGIELAYKTAQENFNASGNNRVILATDGDFNVGITSPGDLEKLIEEKRKSGIFLSTIGVGRDFNDATLETLADKGNGNYSYLDTPKEAEKVFKTELTGTLVTIAKDVKVQLEFDPTRVASYRQIGYENRALANKDFDDDAKDAGELGAGHSVTALYEIVPRGSSAGEIAKLRLRYTEPKGHESKLITASITDGGASAYAASADMQFAAAVAELGMLLRNSPHKGTSTYADAAALARNARGADLEGYREELLRLVDTSRALSGEGGAIASK
jgi:Ca-activated chloride channel family protein